MRVRFSAEIEVPDGVPIKDVEEWLRFELGEESQLARENEMLRNRSAIDRCKNVDAREV